jgi:hypothetical protein
MPSPRAAATKLATMAFWRSASAGVAAGMNDP